MADPEQVRKAGRRLATDLRNLREVRKVTSESIIEATRLTPDVFKDFDESALVDHPAFNRVYLRSVMASYARVLEIDEGLAYRALEEALDGTYAGGLRRVYIQGLSVDEWSEPSSEGDKEPVDETERVVSSSGEPTESDDELVKAQPSRLSTWFNWRRALPFGILFITISVIVVVIVILINRSSNGEQDALTVPTLIEPVPPPEPEWIILGDSIRFDIIATTEHLDPIRVKVDSDLRRPYWIEQLDTLSFFVRSTIIFERELDVADILMDGYLLPDTMINSSGRLEITRDRAQAWLDSLAVERAARNRPFS